MAVLSSQNNLTVPLYAISHFTALITLGYFYPSYTLMQDSTCNRVLSQLGISTFSKVNDGNTPSLSESGIYHERETIYHESEEIRVVTVCVCVWGGAQPRQSFN